MDELNIWLEKSSFPVELGYIHLEDKRQITRYRVMIALDPMVLQCNYTAQIQTLNFKDI